MSWFGWRLWFWRMLQLRHRAKLWRPWFLMTSLLWREWEPRKFPSSHQKLSSRAIGEVEYYRRTVNQWSVANTHILLLPHSLDEAWRGRLPTHQLLPQPCVDLLIANLGEYVSKHVSCWDWMNGNGSILNLVAKVMILCVDMRSSWAHLGVLDTGSQFDGATVVFKDTTMKMWRCRFQSTSLPLHFLDQLHEWKHFASRRRNCQIFRFCCGQCNLSL